MKIVFTVYDGLGKPTEYAFDIPLGQADAEGYTLVTMSSNIPGLEIEKLVRDESTLALGHQVHDSEAARVAPLAYPIGQIYPS